MTTMRSRFRFVVWAACFAVAMTLHSARAQDYIWKLGGDHSIENFDPKTDYSGFAFPRSDLWNMGHLNDLKMDRVNFEGSRFGEMLVQNTSFRGANLRSVDAAGLSDDMTGCDLTDADIRGSALPISKEQLLSTKSYKEKNLAGCAFLSRDLRGVSFAGFNLTGATFSRCDITGCDFTDADITGAAISKMTFAQLRTAKNHKARDLAGIQFVQCDFDGADFRGCKLGPFRECSLKGANMTNALLVELPEDRLTRYPRNFGYGFDQCELEQKTFESTLNYRRNEMFGMTLGHMNLDGWNFRGKKLQAVNFDGSTLTDADFTDAAVTAANFDNTNITKRQWQSTVEYKDEEKFVPPSKTGVDLSGWDFSGMTVSSTFKKADLRNADFSGAKLAHMTFVGCDLAGADFTDTELVDVGFDNSELTWDQFCASQNGQEKRFWLVTFSNQTFRGWDFSNANLEDKTWYNCDYPECRFDNARINMKNFGAMRIKNPVDDYVIARGLTVEQFQSTANYKDKNLREAVFNRTNLSGVDFSGCDLTGAEFRSVVFSDANFKNATIDGVTFGYGSPMSNEQFDSTANTANKTLKNVKFSHCDLSGKDFSDLSLENCRFENCNLGGANFTDTRMTRVRFISWQHASTNPDEFLTESQIKQSWNYKNGKMNEITFEGRYAELWGDPK